MKTALGILFLMFMELHPSHRQVSDVVTTEEYVVYADWLKSFSVKAAPGDIYLYDKTNSVLPFGCATIESKVDSNDGDLWDQLFRLKTEYPLHLGQADGELRTSIPYTVIDKFPDSKLPFHAIQLTRVAFSDDEKEAVLSFTDKRAEVKNDHKEMIFAEKLGDHWSFVTICNNGK